MWEGCERCDETEIERKESGGKEEKGYLKMRRDGIENRRKEEKNYM